MAQFGHSCQPSQVSDRDNMIRDRDRIYGAIVTRRLRAMGIRDKPIAPASPWQNGFAERLIGSIRRECLDHVVIWGEAHLRRILRSYTTTKSGHIGPWTKMRRSGGQFSAPESSVQIRSLVDFITITSESRFSVHTEGDPSRSMRRSEGCAGWSPPNRLA